MGNNILEMSAWSFIKSGGPVMVPILLCSFFALAIVIEKFIFFSSIKTNIKLLKNKIFDHIKNNNIKAAILACETDPSPVAAILKAGLTKFGSSRNSIKEILEDASLFEIPRLEKQLSILASIAHISPLLGLLGTVTGMITCFHTIQVRAASLNFVSPGDLAGGIAEALVTTVAGLMVAIPAYVAYNYFVAYVNNTILEMERAATELVNLMGEIAETGSDNKE